MATRWTKWSLVLLLVTLPGWVAAQDAGEAPREKTVIVVDADGTVTVNGEVVDREAFRPRFEVDGVDGRLRFRVPSVQFEREGGPGGAFHFFHGGDDVDDLLGRLSLPGLETGFFFEDAEVRRMEREVHTLAQRVRRAEAAERPALEQELQAKLDALFEQKMELRAERIERLEAELQQQRERYDARRRAQGEIVERRLRELLGEKDVLDW